MKQILMFTYGILKNSGGTVKRDVTIDADMYDLGAFPAITRLGTGNKAKGNVISVSQAELDRFDQIEGVNSENPEAGLYRREKVWIEEIKEEVFIYLYNGGGRGSTIEEWEYHSVIEGWDL